MKEISRRNFMKMGATGALALAASSANAGVLEAKILNLTKSMTSSS